MLSIGILTHNSPITLKNTLESYKNSGILNYTDDIKCLIQPSIKSEEEINICKQYNLNYILEKNNTMMAGGIKRLVEESNYEYFMFLESDFRSCKNKNITKIVLDFSLDQLKNKKFDVIRLRNLKNPGHPIHWNLQKRHGLNYNNNDELYLCTHYLNDPHVKYSSFIEKINENPILYKISSKNCVYTNNPNITSKEFYIKNILPHAESGQHLEPQIFNFWKNNNFKIGITSGIFTHVRIDGHDNKNCYCCPKEYGGRTNNINCVCCDRPYRPSFFNVEDLSDEIDEIIDEIYIDKLCNTLQFDYYSNKE